MITFKTMPYWKCGDKIVANDFVFCRKKIREWRNRESDYLRNEVVHYICTFLIEDGEYKACAIWRWWWNDFVPNPHFVKFVYLLELRKEHRGNEFADVLVRKLSSGGGGVALSARNDRLLFRYYLPRGWQIINKKQRFVEKCV